MSSEHNPIAVFRLMSSQTDCSTVTESVNIQMCLFVCIFFNYSIESLYRRLRGMNCLPGVTKPHSK